MFSLETLYGKVTVGKGKRIDKNTRDEKEEYM